MASSFSRLIQGVWRLADPKLCIASTVPMVVGTAMAYKALGTLTFIGCF